MIADSIVQGLVKTLTSVRIIKHDQPGKAPNKPYCTWQEISNPANDRGQLSYNWTTNTERVDINKTETIQVEWYTKTQAQNKNKPTVGYKSAYELAEEAILKLKTYTCQAYQKTNNISVMDWTDLTLLTQFMGDINELRATIEIKVNNNLNYTEDTYPVDLDTLDVNLTVEDI